MTTKEANAAAVKAAQTPETNQALREALLTTESRRGLLTSARALLREDRPADYRTLRALLRVLRPLWHERLAVALGIETGADIGRGLRALAKLGGIEAGGLAGLVAAVAGAPGWPTDEAGKRHAAARIVTALEGLTIVARPEGCERLAAVAVNGEGLSALAWLHRRLSIPVQPETRRDRRILPVVRPVEREGVIPATLTGRYELDPGAPSLPLFPERPKALRVPLLDLVDAYGVPVMARGRGAPLPARLHVGLLLAVRREDRGRESVRLTMLLGDLIAALYPTGQFRAGRHWPKLQATMEDAARFGFHDGRGRWRAVALRYAPDNPDMGAEVVFDIAFPPGAVAGPAVDLAALNRLSVESSPRWRAAIAAHSILWIPGMTRRPVPTKSGRPSGRWGWAQDPNAYPIVTLEDRRRLAFGARDHKNRTRREVDDAWSDLPGLVVAERSAVAPKTGAVGWRLLPAPNTASET